MSGHHGLRLRHTTDKNKQAQTADQAFHAFLSFALFFANTHKRKKVFRQRALLHCEKGGAHEKTYRIWPFTMPSK